MLALVVVWGRTSSLVAHEGHVHIFQYRSYQPTKIDIAEHLSWFDLAATMIANRKCERSHPHGWRRELPITR